MSDMLSCAAATLNRACQSRPGHRIDQIGFLQEGANMLAHTRRIQDAWPRAGGRGWQLYTRSLQSTKCQVAAPSVDFSHLAAHPRAFRPRGTMVRAAQRRRCLWPRENCTNRASDEQKTTTANRAESANGMEFAGANLPAPTACVCTAAGGITSRCAILRTIVLSRF